MIGQRIRNFSILEEIGAGGYGLVYKAHDDSLNRDVAVKVILPQHANKAEFVENFETEARLVARLEHINIVPLYDYWRDDNGAFLVMRYIKGGSLRGLMTRQGALSLSQTVRIIEQVGEALNVAHENGVIHRDLKPDNILIDERGNAYLTDFGIAKNLSANDAASATDAIKGTFAYLSPEQIQNSPVSPQTDIYALGVMLFEMLVGRHPFQDTPVAMMVMKHLQENIPSLHDTRQDLPESLDTIIEKATQKEPSLRYTSTLEIVSELKEVVQQGDSLTSKPIQSTSVSVRKTPSSPEERNRHAMLQNVRVFWIEGVLENSLHGSAMIELGLKSEGQAVDNPWETLLRTPNGDTQLSSNTRILDIFDRLNGKLLILGDPGGGKTTTMLELARDLLLRAETDNEHPLPVVFNLSSWSEKQLPLNEWLVEELNNKYQVPRKVGSEWVENDSLLLLLDGLDEVAGAVREACVDAINGYREEHGFVDIVVCSRIKDYDALSNQLKLNGAIIIQPLDEAQVQDYLQRLGPDVAIVRDLIGRDEQLRELSQSPLMLSIMIFAYRGVSAQAIPDFDNIDTQRKHLFDVYVQRMFDRRIGEKAYSVNETRHYLSWLAKQMQQHAQSIFHIELLQPSWLSAEAEVKRFPHLVQIILGIYMLVVWTIAGLIFLLAAPQLSVLFAPLLGVAGFTYGYLMTHPWVFDSNFIKNWTIILLIGIGAGFTMFVGIFPIHPTWLAIVLSALFGLSLAGAAIAGHMRWMKKLRTSREEIVPIERLEYSLHVVDWKHFPITGGATLILPLMITYMLMPDEVRFEPLRMFFMIVVALVPAISFFIILDAFTSAPLQQRSQPNEGMKTSLRNVIHFMIFVSLVTIFWSIAVWVIGVSWQTATLIWFTSVFMYGGDTFLSHGGVPITQHLFLRYLLRRLDSIPANYAKFLDHAVSLVLLRKVGGGYIFIHRYLLEYFADLE